MAVGGDCQRVNALRGLGLGEVSGARVELVAAVASGPDPAVLDEGVECGGDGGGGGQSARGAAVEFPAGEGGHLLVDQHAQGVGGVAAGRVGGDGVGRGAVVVDEEPHEPHGVGHLPLVHGPAPSVVG